jgi:cell division protein FtsI/penicillin-binding protein 2
MRLRLAALLLAMAVAFVAIGIRLFELQTHDRTRLASLGVGQRVRTVELPAERGNIFDRTGKVLAVSVPQTTITADPRVIKDPGGYAAKLAPIVNVDQAALAAHLGDYRSAFAYVARKVDDATAAKVRKLDLPGISFVAESKRFYPSVSLAAPVLGFVGTDNEGLGGLEYRYDATLHGTAGKVQVERDPQGNDIPGGERQVQPAQRGQDVVLTLDQSLQWNTEQVLAQGVTAAGAKGGTAIVVDVQTGDVLAMATVNGATDNGQPAHAAGAQEKNRTVTDVYEPGSTNKVITMSGAIQERLVTPDTTFDDIGQSVTVGGKEYSDVEEHSSSMSVTDILKYSSNVGTIRIASMLGKQRFDHYLQAFGFGRPTGTGLPGEAAGLILPLSQYNDTSMASMPIGYGVAVTAMQMLDVYATIANHGMARPPRLVAATIDAQGKRHDEPLSPPQPVVSSETAQAVTGMLKQVVTEGTGTKAAIAGYPVAGKTGTARKAPYTGEYVASFAGFAPADAPRLAAIVVVDAPGGNSYFASDVAAPVFKQVMQFALTYEHVPTAS